ncbi:hypothetical protein ACN47E_009303 [Coniothyrium glycines]
MDRTIENGTGDAGNYPPEIAEIYNNVEKTPDDLLLWFHHVSYTRKLKSGKTVIQEFYNAHYDGAAAAQIFVLQWNPCKAGHSLVWRDAINQYFNDLSRIEDETGRVGNYPYRIEAESMILDGYKLFVVNPFRTASRFNAIVTTSNTTAGTASTTVPFASGTYDVAINNFDLFNGTSMYKLEIGDRTVGTWFGNNGKRLGHEPSGYFHGNTATRITFRGVEVRQGDFVCITSQPGSIEPAPLDYISSLPPGIVDQETSVRAAE